MQAVILAGGSGTRLRPLTSRIAKPVVTLVDRPFIVYMLDWLRRHGCSDVILCCGFQADGLREVLGDGSSHGIRLRYVAESQPLGTGGPLLLARELLDERFVVCNGDLLTDIDLGAPLPALELIAPERAVSIEREVWPALIGAGLYGYRADGYWLDIGTPERYMQGSFDIVTGAVATNSRRNGSSTPIGRSCEIATDARIGELVVLGEGVRVGAGASIERSVVLAGAQIGAGAVLRGSIVGERAEIGPNVELKEGVVVGEDAQIAAGRLVAAGTRLAAGERL